MSLQSVIVFNAAVGHLWLIATMVSAAFLVTPWVLLAGLLVAAYMIVNITRR